MNNVVITLHANSCDGEDGGCYEDYIEEDIDLALQHSEHHTSKVPRAGHNAEWHDQDGTQKVHCTKMAQKYKFPEMRGFDDNHKNSSVGQKCKKI